MPASIDEPPAITRLPGWIVRASPDFPENAAFLAGAALAVLDRLVNDPSVPQALWRARLALDAATSTAHLEGRREGAAALRDALHLRRPGDHLGPAGEIFAQWTRAVVRPVPAVSLGAALPRPPPEPMARALEAGQRAGLRGTPAGQAAAVLEAVLAAVPRAETSALILADAALACGLGWDPILPLLAVGLKSRDLSRRGEDLRLACHRALLASAAPAARLAGDLGGRSRRLRAITPKLRAAGAEQAVALFLSRDALAPAALTGFMSDRAARRLCDRLVELGVLRELTGRDSFRLYGV